MGFLASKKMQLLRWIFEQHEQGLQVTTGLIRKVAEKFLHEFHAKTMSAREQVVRRFMHSVGLTHCLGTHTTQKFHKEMEVAACNFMELMQHKVADMKPDNVLSMDQMPIPFSYHNKCTWEAKGVKTVHTQSSNFEIKRATFAATVTMSGEVLPRFLIFRGKQNGQIEQKELPNHPPVCLYAIQKKAWMDDSMLNL